MWWNMDKRKKRTLLAEGQRFAFKLRVKRMGVVNEGVECNVKKLMEDFDSEVVVLSCAGRLLWSGLSYD